MSPGDLRGMRKSLFEIHNRERWRKATLYGSTVRSTASARFQQRRKRFGRFGLLPGFMQHKHLRSQRISLVLPLAYRLLGQLLSLGEVFGGGKCAGRMCSGLALADESSARALAKSPAVIAFSALM